MSKKPKRLSTYAQQQIYENTVRRQANEAPFINIGRYGITIPNILTTLTRILSTDAALELPIPNASRLLYIADGIEADSFSRYAVGEIQLLVYDGYMDRSLDEFAFDFAQVNNKMTMFVFKYNLVSDQLSKELKVFNLYNVCNALIYLYQMDGGCLYGTIYNNIIRVAPLALTCYIWQRVFNEQLNRSDFSLDRFPNCCELDFLSDKVLDIIYSYSEEYIFNFGILNDLV